MKIFLLDDDQQILHGLLETLKPAGYNCAFSDNPLEAIKIFEKEKFDVLLTDYKMPDMNGLEVLKYVNEKKLIDYLIIISGYAEEYSISNHINKNTYAFFKKPVNVNDLMKILEKINDELKIKQI